AQDLADRLSDVLVKPEAWDRLHATLRPPTGHAESARAHADLYRRLLKDRRSPLGAAQYEAAAQAVV
ncbi:glycosyl transferase, partial [Sinorhizobium meliloti]